MSIKVLIVLSLVAVAASSPAPTHSKLPLVKGRIGLQIGASDFGKDLKSLFKGLIGHKHLARKDLSYILNLKLNGFNDVCDLMARVVIALCDTIEASIRGLGTLLSRLIISFLKIVICNVGGFGKTNPICRSDVNLLVGVQASEVTSPRAVINLFGLTDCKSRLFRLISVHSRGKGIKGLRGSLRVILKLSMELAERIEAVIGGGSLNKSDLQFCFRRITKLLGCIGNSRQRKLGIKIATNFAKMCNNFILDAGFTDFGDWNEVEQDIEYANDDNAPWAISDLDDSDNNGVTLSIGGLIGNLFKGLLGVTRLASNLLQDILKISIKSVEDVFNLGLKIVLGLGGLLDATIRGLGTLLVRIVAGLLKIVVCFGGKGKYGICTAAWERQVGVTGTVTSIDHVIRLYGLRNCRSRVDKYIRIYTKGAGIGSTSGSMKILLQTAQTLADMIQAKKWNANIVVITFRHITYLLGAIGNSHARGVGTSLCNKFVPSCGKFLTSAGYPGFGDELTKTINIVETANNDDQSWSVDVDTGDNTTGFINDNGSDDDNGNDSGNSNNSNDTSNDDKNTSGNKGDNKGTSGDNKGDNKGTSGDNKGDKKGTSGDNKGDKKGTSGDNKGDKKGSSSGNKGDNKGTSNDNKGDKKGTSGDNKGSSGGNKDDNKGTSGDNKGNSDDNKGNSDDNTSGSEGNSGGNKDDNKGNSGDSGNTSNDSGNTSSDSGNTSNDSGNTSSDNGNNGSDSGNTSSDSGNKGSDSGNNGSDSGNTSSDNGNNGSDNGNNGSDSGNTSSDNGNNGSDNGNTSSDSGNTKSDSDNTSNDSGTKDGNTGNDSGNNSGNNDNDVDGNTVVNVIKVIPGVTSISSNIINEIIKIKINTFLDVVNFVTKLVIALGGIIDSVVSGLGSLLIRIVAVIFKILYCVVGVGNDKSICTKEWNAQFGITGEATTAADLIALFRLTNCKNDVATAVSTYTKGKGISSTSGFINVILQKLTDLSTIVSSGSITKENFSTVFVHVVSIFGSVTNSFKQGSGTLLIQRLIPRCAPILVKQGFSDLRPQQKTVVSTINIGNNDKFNWKNVKSGGDSSSDKLATTVKKVFKDVKANNNKDGGASLTAVLNLQAPRNFDDVCSFGVQVVQALGGILDVFINGLGTFIARIVGALINYIVAILGASRNSKSFVSQKAYYRTFGVTVSGSKWADIAAGFKINSAEADLDGILKAHTNGKGRKSLSGAKLVFFNSAYNLLEIVKKGSGIVEADLTSVFREVTTIIGGFANSISADVGKTICDNMLPTASFYLERNGYPSLGGQSNTIYTKIETCNNSDAPWAKGATTTVVNN